MDDKQLKAMLTEMLAWFHNYCEAHGLRYYLAEGTMLGAARHGGFIPWDDDLDVAMPREDYERLLAEFACEDMPYVLEGASSPNRDYSYTFAKLFHTGTTLVENCVRPFVRGIYIDIFPLDYVGDSLEEGKRFFKKFKLRKKVQYAVVLRHFGKWKKGRSFVKNLFSVLAGKALRLGRGWLFHPRQMARRLNKDFQSYGKASLYVCNFPSAYDEKEIMPLAYYGTPAPYTFEGLTVWGVEKPEEYLTHLYGDWRKLPPPEKRVSVHDYISCDLNRSYLTHKD